MGQSISSIIKLFVIIINLKMIPKKLLDLLNLFET